MAQAVRYDKLDPVGSAGVMAINGSVIEPAMAGRRGWTPLARSSQPLTLAMPFDTWYTEER
jgi:hypothetical protein